MFVRVLKGAFLVCALAAGAGHAQTAAEVGGPRELPPPGFSGQQFVDSRGCVFLRAGLGGTVNWVPRVDASRKAMCGYPPTFAGGTRMAAAAEPAPTPAPAPAARTMPAENPAPVRVADREPPPESYTPAPVAGLAVPMMPRAQVVAAAPAAPVATPSFSAERIGCTRSAPVLQRLALTNGGSVLVCTRGDGTLEGLRAPIYPAGSPVGASLVQPGDGGDQMPSGQMAETGNTASGVRLADQGIRVPEGYKLAWEDDRLNPLRGVGTAAGQAAQDRVWTRQVPARPVEGDATRQADRGPSAPAGQTGVVTVSTKSQAVTETVAAPSAGRVFVQVGSFAVPENADGAASRLSALGLPVARSKARIGGKAVQVVLAGPFASTDAARGALSAARGAGFADAFIR